MKSGYRHLKGEEKLRGSLVLRLVTVMEACSPSKSEEFLIKNRSEASPHYVVSPRTASYDYQCVPVVEDTINAVFTCNTVRNI